MADMITGADEADVQRRVEEGGFQPIDLAGIWAEVPSQSYERRVRAVALVGAAVWQVAMQLMARRSPGEVPRPMPVADGLARGGGEGHDGALRRGSE
eukprot:5558769-Pyramimonas_sp.AAC.1